MARMAISTELLRLIQLGNRVMQWISTIIVLGIVSYLIHKGPKGEHLIYEEVIAALSAAAFLPGLALGFVKGPALGQALVGIDVAFSYLWLTSFIFEAQDYDWHGCAATAPPGGHCSLKRASEAFTFLAFFFTFIAVLLDVGFIFPKAGPTGPATETHDKETGATTGATNGTSNGQTTTT